MGKRSQQKIITREVKIIRALREKRKLSVQKASEVIGTNKSTLTALENGRIDLSGEWVKKIIKAYGINEVQFKQMVEAKDSIREEIVAEINEYLGRVTYEKLLVVRQVVMSF